ncbi:hypothetical protein Tco_1546903, partial [Tanacetum coccineum]
MELRKKRLEQYIWITPSRLRPEPITNVKIHPNSKPLVLIVYRANDRRNFQVHNPFKFADSKVTELDELGPIIEKKKNKIVGELMISLGNRKRKHIELEPEIKVPGLECNRKFHEGVPFVNNMVIEEPKYGMFFINVFGDEAFQRMNDINKVGFDALLTYLVMASNITTPKNTRFDVLIEMESVGTGVSTLRSCLKASKIRNIGGIVMGKDGKPLKPIRKVQISEKEADNVNTQNPSSANGVESVVEPTKTMPSMKAPGHTSSFTSIVQQKPSKQVVKIKELRNSEKVVGAAVAIPLEAVEAVSS